MDNKTAVDYLVEQLQAPCRGIPSHIIEEAKRLEKEQIIKANLNGQAYHQFSYESRMAEAEDYYNQTYKQNK